MGARLLVDWVNNPAPDPPALLLRLAVGLVLSVAVAWAGYRGRSLSRSGFYGAAAVGTLVFGLGGWPWGLVLIAFFATSSALSHFEARRKRAAAEQFAKTGRRDLGQVLANGGLGALLAVAAAATGGASPLFFFAFAGAIAAVNADTWATELGILSGTPPHLITTGDCVEPGRSGAISFLGFVASLTGAWLIGFLAFAFRLAQQRLAGLPLSPIMGWLPLLAAFGGVAGSLFDSLLGATRQNMYYCPLCGKETEQPVHRCGRQPIYIRGWHWLDNDVVNLFSSLAGALVTAGMAALILYLVY